MREIIKQFYDAMCASGSVPASMDDLLPDGQRHYARLAEDKTTVKKLSYCLTIDDEFGHGWWLNFREGITHSWHSKSSKKWTDEERDAWRAKVDARKAADEAEEIARHAEKAAIAAAEWLSFQPADPNHPYLVRKGIQPHGARQDGEDLIIRMVAEGKTQGYQRITPEGDKFYIEGARKKGCYCPLANPKEDLSTIIVCEGFATGGTDREATDLAVLCAFDAGNLKPVAISMREKYPQAKIIIASDWDRRTKKDGTPWNPGLDAAQQAAASCDGLVIWPEFADDEEGSDFNDYAATHGLDAVRNRIMEALSPKTSMLVTGEEGNPLPDQHLSGDAIIPGVKNSDIADPEQMAREDLMEMFVFTKRPDPQWIANPSNPYAKPPRFIDCEKNVQVFLTKYQPLSNIFKFDKFARRITVTRCPPWENEQEFRVREWHDTDVTKVLLHMNEYHYFPSRGRVEKIIESVAMEFTIDPPITIFDGMEWDGIPRLDNLMRDYMGAVTQDSDYLSAVGRMWMISAVARQYKPGCQVDYMPVFEGLMGIRKSSFMRELNTFGDQCFFLEDINFSQLDDKDTIAKLQGKTMVEFADLAKFKNANIEQIRAWVTRRVDEGRLAYRRDSEPFPRRFVMAATSNSVTYLSELDGERRMWPISCGAAVDIQKLRNDRWQLWAEAVHRYKAGEKWWPEKTDTFWNKAQKEQIKRVAQHPWDELIYEITEREKRPMTFSEIAREMGIPTAAQKDQASIALIKAALTKLEWKRVDYDKKSGKKFPYIPPNWDKVPVQARLDDDEEEIKWA